MLPLLIAVKLKVFLYGNFSIYSVKEVVYKVSVLLFSSNLKKKSSFLGDLFDIQGFHSVILDNGAVPLSVLEELVTEWQQDVINGNSNLAPR